MLTNNMRSSAGVPALGRTRSNGAHYVGDSLPGSVEIATFSIDIPHLFQLVIPILACGSVELERF